MSRKTFLNILENAFAPSVNHAMREDLLGSEPLVTTLAAETTLTIDFTKNRFHVVELGDDDLSALNATVLAGKDSLKPGEEVFLKIIQDGTGARTITWGTGILTDVTISSTTNDIDILVGIFDGTNIIFGALAKNVT
jgi:hypothetical protein